MKIIKRLPLLIAGGVGYVLGTKAGRERYEQIRSTFYKVKEDPRVQQKAQEAASFAREQAPVVKDKVSGAADSAATKVGSSGGSSTDPHNAETKLNPESTARQDDPYPKGDLP